MWKIEVSRQADKFIKKENIKDNKLLLLIQRFINYYEGMNESIDVKKLKGKWEGYHRIRIGKIRMIIKVDFKKGRIFIDTIDYRGDVYK
jgi:mRNA interferase RelE/StbE